MTETVKIGECPFCGNADCVTTSIKRWVTCCSCRAYGPTRGTEQEAIEAWNELGDRIKALRKERDKAQELARRFYSQVKDGK